MLMYLDWVMDALIVFITLIVTPLAVALTPEHAAAATW
jgi:hypothetical protein